MRRGAEEGAADRRRRPEQQRHEPSAAVEVAQQREVALGRERSRGFSGASFRLAERGPERPWQGEVEVHAGDGLHHPAVAMAQSAPVHVLHRAHVGTAVVRDGDRAVAGDHARHARRPQNLVVDQRIGELVQVPEVAGGLAHAAPGGSHELQQRLGEVGGDGGVGEGGAERRRVGPLGDVTGAVDAQALFLHPDPPSREQARTEGVDEISQALLHGAGQVEISPRVDGGRNDERGFCAISGPNASAAAHVLPRAGGGVDQSSDSMMRCSRARSASPSGAAGARRRRRRWTASTTSPTAAIRKGPAQSSAVPARNGGR